MAVVMAFPSTPHVIWRAVLAMVLASTAIALPYIPTTILLSRTIGSSNDIAYIFSPNGNLLSINVSSTLSATALKPETLASTLPFLSGQKNVAFTPSVLDNGTLAVLAGDCSVATAAALWTLTPGADGKSSWNRHATSPSNNWDYGQGGPYFLGGSLSFSAQLAPVVSDPIIYVYGGMCPYSNATTSSGQSSATYSNRMLKISPPARPAGSEAAYTVSYASSAGPPIAEAGFTFTELAPSLSNRSGIVTQQTSHVLLGGHTKQAFINMSTAAIWSLPEETWSFVSIAGPSPTGKTDLLAAKDTTVPSMDSRSGHTAVLSEDGTSLVILGGWVGDLTQPAEPQLAVITIGAAFGDWQWSVPTAQPSGSGIYGHGAALLPGNVMMVYGGYEISPSKRRRAAAPKMFFNITSLSWTDEYTNPVSAVQHGGASPTPGSPNGGGFTTGSGTQSGSASDSNSQQLGFGLGLGLGIPLLAIIIGMGLCLYRRRSHRRARRDEAIRSLAQGIGPLPIHQHNEMLERDDGDFPWDADTARDWYTGGHDPYVQGRRSLGYETLRGGGSSRSGSSLYMPPPPMATVNRPRAAARGLYQPSTSLGSSGGQYDFAPLRIPVKNEIHPIYEDDEEEEDGDLAHAPLCLHTGGNNENDEDDPFATPTNPATPTTALFPPPTTSSSSNRSASPEMILSRGGRAQDAEVQGWVSDVDAADAVLTAKIGRHGSTTTTPPRVSPGHSQPGQAGLRPQSAGRVSPHRRNSSRSGAAASDPDETRTGSNLSDRSAFSFVAGAERVNAMRPQSSHADRHFRSPPGMTSATAEARLGTSGSSTSGGSFSTAKSTFAALQAEGPSLLHGETDTDRDRHEMVDEDDEYIHIPGSPSKNKPRRSWLGSLRRVFSGGTPSDGSSRADSPTRESLLDGGSSDYEPRLVGMGPNGTLLTRRKQGREAWDNTLQGGKSGEEEWDIERAVEQRLVQVMFTVPKERLRVVNAEIEREEEAVIVDPEEEEGWDGDSQKGSCAGQGAEEARRVEIRGSRSEQEMAETAARALLLRQNAAVQQDTNQDEESGNHNTKKGKAMGEWQQEIEHLELLPPALGNPGGISPSASLRTASITTTTPIHVAEAVRLERPRTRVLEMVESIESRSSRDGSPAGSPVR